MCTRNVSVQHLLTPIESYGSHILDEKWTQEGVQHAVPRHLEGDDVDEAANKTANSPILCQPHGLEFTIMASCSLSLVLVHGAW